jgi:hypothetical protein
VRVAKAEEALNVGRRGDNACDDKREARVEAVGRVAKAGSTLDVERTTDATIERRGWRPWG